MPGALGNTSTANQTIDGGSNLALPIRLAKFEIESSENSSLNRFGFYRSISSRFLGRLSL
uniref:Uncharacterized protein n=1 Tax=Arundo donax TaxID=35708 RepID=A0A0A9H9Q5_ARUDO